MDLYMPKYFQILFEFSWTDAENFVQVPHQDNTTKQQNAAIPIRKLETSSANTMSCNMYSVLLKLVSLNTWSILEATRLDTQKNEKKIGKMLDSSGFNNVIGNCIYGTWFNSCTCICLNTFRFYFILVGAMPKKFVKFHIKITRPNNRTPPSQ
jgi:hypothetical protein